MFDPEESLTHEQIMRRFEKIFNRKMTPAEKRAFFLDLDKEDNPPKRKS